MVNAVKGSATATNIHVAFDIWIRPVSALNSTKLEPKKVCSDDHRSASEVAKRHNETYRNELSWQVHQGNDGHNADGVVDSFGCALVREDETVGCLVRQIVSAGSDIRFLPYQLYQLVVPFLHLSRAANKTFTSSN